MNEEHPVRACLMSLGIGVLLLFGWQFSHAQVISEYQVKAAYLYSFAKFVQWPAETFSSAADPIRLCVLDDMPFQLQLNQIVQNKNIAGHPVLVVTVSNGEQARGCQVLFISSSQGGEAPQAIESLRGTSVLTVGETKGFMEKGGIINFVLKSGQVHFEVNDKAATQAHLRISSRLLSVAKVIIE